MTLLIDRPETTTTTSAPATIAALRGGSYITRRGGFAAAGTEGSYVTVAGNRNAGSRTRGSYVSVAGTPGVDAAAIEGSYVTLPAAA